MSEYFMLVVKSKSLISRAVSVQSALAAIIFALMMPASASAYSTAGLRDKDVQKAEKIIAKLRRLESVTASPPDSQVYKAEMSRLYPGLFVDASELGESDLKTDLTTAAFLYETAYRTQVDSGAGKTNCDGEVREIYLNLCRQTPDGNPARLLWSKARLHTKWGEAVVRSYRGATDSVTLATLSEIEAERRVDIILAERAMAALRKLAGRVDAYSSSGAFEEAVRAKNLSYEQLSRETSEALSTVDQSLALLPRGRLYLLLDNARCSYRDGLFWWSKARLTQGMTVSVNNLAAPDPLKVIGISPGTVNSTILANWMNALRYTQEAEKAIVALKS
jgi:hypothetical protein